jgi:hypothetical protein
MIMWKLLSIPSNFPDAVQCVIRQTQSGVEVRQVTDPEYLKWLEEGNTPEPADEG